MRTLHIDNLDYARWDPCQWTLSAGFNQDLVPLIQQALHKRDKFALLQHRLAARNFYQAAFRAESPNVLEDLFRRFSLATRERVLTVAPRTTQVAAGQSHEHTGQTRVRRLTLQRFVDFGDLHLLIGQIGDGSSGARFQP